MIEIVEGPHFTNGNKILYKGYPIDGLSREDLINCIYELKGMYDQAVENHKQALKA